jgi:hypothetical protein
MLRGGCDGLGDHLRRDGRVDELAAQVLRRRSALGVMVRPRQPRLARSSSGVNHEILHHGQLIVYANALGRAFPASWASFGQ